MTAMTAVHAARAARTKPPVAYTPDAIKAAIAHEAANGPSYVRIKALNMMARLEGMFDTAKLTAKQAFQDAQAAIQETVEKAKEQANGGKKSVGKRVMELMNGAEPTKAELRAAGLATDDDEDGKTDEDEPP